MFNNQHQLQKSINLFILTFWTLWTHIFVQQNRSPWVMKEAYISIHTIIQSVLWTYIWVLQNHSVWAMNIYGFSHNHSSELWLHIWLLTQPFNMSYERIYDFSHNHSIWSMNACMSSQQPVNLGYKHIYAINACKLRDIKTQ